MKAKKYLGLAILISAGLALSGCGEQFPTLTEEEYNQTVEYAVGLLMKYSANAESKLTYVDPAFAKEVIEQEKQKNEQEIQNAFENATDWTSDVPDSGSSFASGEESGEPGEGSSKDSSFAQNDDNDKDAAKEDDAVSGKSSGSEASDLSNADNSASDSGNGSFSDDSGAVVMSDDESREIMDDIFLSYQGYSISKTYPESSKSYVVNADKGKRLLVLRFDLYNASDNSKSVNMLKLNLLFQIVLNGKNLGYTSVTFLPNDLSSYIGTIDSRAHESLVVLTQIDEKSTSNVETLGLIVTRDGKDTKVILR